MGEEPDTIRREIEQTRDRMGDTVEAIGYKADVPARSKEKVTGSFSGAKDRIRGTASDVRERIGGTASAAVETTPDADDVKQAARRGVSVAQENPLGLAIGSIAFGFLAGMLIPSTRVENEKLGPMAEQAKEQARQTGQEAVEHGKRVAEEVSSTVQEHAQQAKDDVSQTARQAAQEHGEQLRQTAQGNAQQVREQAPSG